MVVGQQKSLGSLRIHRGFELSLIEIDHFLLLTMNPPCQDHQEQLPGTQDEVHAQHGW